jgi:hypothetical protein
VLHTERPEEEWWASFSKTVLKVWANHERRAAGLL